MARFPQTEPEVAALALLITEGLATASDDFPAPPFPASELQAMLDAYRQASVDAVNAEMVARGHHAEKDEALETLIDGMKATLKYAEVAARDAPEKLRALGWGPRREPSGLDVPGEVRDMSVVSEGDGWVMFDWKAPVDGGAVAAYTIQRRKRDGGSWQDVGTSIVTQQLLSGQERGVELEYRVVAINKAGTGKPSAAVMVVL